MTTTTDPVFTLTVMATRRRQTVDGIITHTLPTWARMKAQRERDGATMAARDAERTIAKYEGQLRQAQDELAAIEAALAALRGES